MTIFNPEAEWVIMISSGADKAHISAQDLSRCIGLLAKAAGNDKAGMPEIIKAEDSVHANEGPVIILNCEDRGMEYNGFGWRVEPERVEIFGESERGLCNGIYNFLSELGLAWPVPGQEKIPPRCFSLKDASAYVSSHCKANDLSSASWKRFLPAGKKELKAVLKKGDAFAAWAARNLYDAIVLPLTLFKSGAKKAKIAQLKKHADNYGITLEAGGRDLSSLVPKKYFFAHRDFFRLKDGKRTKDHHFCSTNPGTIDVIRKEAAKAFTAAGGIKTFHLWPDKEAETAWCSCPSCRAFTKEEQNRISINAAADALALINKDACVTFYEKTSADIKMEDIKIPTRENVFKMEKLPLESKIET